MNRRVWIRQITILGGGVLFLPACMNDGGAVSIALKSLNISAKQEALLAEVAEAIIPETESYGAKTLNLHQFLLKMLDDCYDHQKQAKFMSGLSALNGYSNDILGVPFTQSAREDKLTLFRNIAGGKSNQEDLKYFLTQTRHWIIKGYDTSEYFMTKIIPYELVPERFHGCVKVFPAF